MIQKQDGVSKSGTHFYEYEKLITENRKLKKSESIVYNTQKPNG